MIAALFVAHDGPYVNQPGIDAWTEERDARLYPGPHPVIAHPPCERWGRYWFGGPSVKERKLLGDDLGCFGFALMTVRAFGGVLEHPAATHAWKIYELAAPPIYGGWVSAGDGVGMVCHVEQGHYGHPARKATWLYAVAPTLPLLKWGPAPTGKRLDEGFHSKEERAAKRAAGQKPVPRLSKRENTHTPTDFMKVLIEIARGAKITPRPAVRGE
jgi:hypothetical protein